MKLPNYFKRLGSILLVMLAMSLFVVPAFAQDENPCPSDRVPFDAPLDGSVGEILSPLNCDTVPANPQSVTISGTATINTQDSALWVLVYTVDGLYYPQRLDVDAIPDDGICAPELDILNADDGTWDTPAMFGTTGSGGEQFEIVLVIADANVSELFATEWANGCPSTTDGLTYDEIVAAGTITELNSIVVFTAAPCISFNLAFDVVIEVLEDSGDYSGALLDVTGNGAAIMVSVDSPSLFSAGPTIAEDGSLSFTPAPDEFGIAAITLSNCIAESVSTFIINVLPVNDAPVVEGAAEVSVLEDSGAYAAQWATVFTPGPANEGEQTLSTTSELVDPADAGLFAEQPSVDNTGFLTFTPADETFGIATVILTVQDDGGTDNGGVDTTVVEFDIIIIPVNDPPDCSAVTVAPHMLWPPNHTMEDVVISGVTDVDSTVFLFDLEITSNEPVNDIGDGNTSPDWLTTPVVLDVDPATLVVDDTTTEFGSVRAERSGVGNGRIYTIAYTVNDADFTPDLGDDFTLADVVDGQDGVKDCSGTVYVYVPHDMGNGIADANPPAVAADVRLGDTVGSAGISAVNIYLDTPNEPAVVREPAPVSTPAPVETTPEPTPTPTKSVINPPSGG